MPFRLGTWHFPQGQGWVVFWYWAIPFSTERDILSPQRETVSRARTFHNWSWDLKLDHCLGWFQSHSPLPYCAKLPWHIPTFLQQPLECLWGHLFPHRIKGSSGLLFAVIGTHVFSSLGSESGRSVRHNLGHIIENAQPMLYHWTTLNVRARSWHRPFTGAELGSRRSSPQATGQRIRGDYLEGHRKLSPNFIPGYNNRLSKHSMTEDSGQGLTTKSVVCLLERTVRFEEVGRKDQKSLFTSWLIWESWLTTVNFTMSYLKKWSTRSHYEN